MDPYKFSYHASQDNISLSIYNTGYQKCEPGYTWGPATRDHYVLHFAAEGKGVLKGPFGTLEIPEGGLFCIRPGELCCYIADEISPWEYYWVGFNGTEAHHLLGMTPFREGVQLIVPENPERLRRCLKRIYDARGNGPAAEARMLGGLYLFLGALMEEPGGGQPRQSTARQYVDQAVRYISRNFSRDITIEDIADAVGISPSHLYRVFSQELSMAPTKFLTQYRIAEACTLLRSGGMTVGEVAASVGFSDPLYFSRVFKKVKGSSPTAYERRADDKEE
ncbi:MAG: AraC family transcriptional regulator [Oscillospiraceae bacterium]|nr:AraC family transcriptional regulator [Oscillospiraceae bacterium]